MLPNTRTARNTTRCYEDNCTVCHHSTFYLQCSLHPSIKANDQNAVCSHCMVQDPHETEFTELGFSLKPLAYFEGCYKKLLCEICFLYFKAATLRQFFTAVCSIYIYIRVCVHIYRCVYIYIYMVSVSSEFLLNY